MLEEILVSVSGELSNERSNRLRHSNGAKASDFSLKGFPFARRV